MSEHGKDETLSLRFGGPTVRAILLAAVGAVLGGAGVSVAAPGAQDPGPETARRLATLEAAQVRGSTQLEELGRRSERIETKLDRLIERSAK